MPNLEQEPLFGPTTPKKRGQLFGPTTPKKREK